MPKYTMEEIMKYWIEQRKFLDEIIKKSKEAKDKIDIGDYAYAKDLLDDIIREAERKIKEVV
jgi:polyhydroxyalkanoate synthesis regulator phasin